MRIRTPQELLDYLAADAATSDERLDERLGTPDRYEMLSISDRRVPADWRTSHYVREMMRGGCLLCWDKDAKAVKLVSLPAKYERMIPS